MRLAIFLLTVLVTLGCSNKQSNADHGEPIVKYGIITDKEAVDLESAESHTNVDTSVYASISSGGSFSIGLGFLLAPFKSSEVKEDPIRYEVEFLDGGEITIYHLSSLFEVNDCVEITAYPDESEEPPTMVRSKDGCTQ